MTSLANLLLSSRAFKTPAITNAFFRLLSEQHDAQVPIAIIVNAVKEGKQHPQNLALLQKIKSLGFSNTTLVDVLTDNLTHLREAQMIVLNGGFEFYLLHCLKQSGAFSMIKDRIMTGIPAYGISAGAIALGPDEALFEALYPEDN